MNELEKAFERFQKKQTAPLITPLQGQESPKPTNSEVINNLAKTVIQRPEVQSFLNLLDLIAREAEKRNNLKENSFKKSLSFRLKEYRTEDNRHGYLREIDRNLPIKTDKPPVKIDVEYRTENYEYVFRETIALLNKDRYVIIRSQGGDLSSGYTLLSGLTEDDQIRYTDDIVKYFASAKGPFINEQSGASEPSGYK
jgi:hypothetical protein